MVFNREDYFSNKPLALLAEKTEKKIRITNTLGKEEEVSIYHRLGLVELENSELQSLDMWETVIIGNNSFTQQPSEQVSLIEVPPKGNN